MATMNISKMKEKAARQAQQMQEIFASWKEGKADKNKAENIFKSVIGATGATFQKMLADKALMEAIMENELNVAETCMYLMEESEINQRQERARGLNAEQQALLRAAVAELSGKAIQEEKAFALMLRVMNEEQMQVLVTIYGPSFVK